MPLHWAQVVLECRVRIVCVSAALLAIWLTTMEWCTCVRSNRVVLCRGQGLGGSRCLAAKDHKKVRTAHGLGFVEQTELKTIERCLGVEWCGHVPYVALCDSCCASPNPADDDGMVSMCSFESGCSVRRGMMQ